MKVCKAILRLAVWASVFFCGWVCGYILTPTIRDFLNPSSLQRLLAFCDGFSGRILFDESNAWYDAQYPLLWAHAGGGALAFYTNSREAIEDSLAKGYRVIEIDVSVTSDEEPVLSHDFMPSGVPAFAQIPTLQEFMSLKICGKYTPMTLKDLLDGFSGEDVWWSIDPHCSWGGFDLIDWFEKNATREQMSRIIYQIYTEKELKRLASSNPFGALHFCMGNLAPYMVDARLERLCNMLTDIGVRSISFGEQPITDDVANAIDVFHKHNIRVSVACVNTVKRCLEWRRVGADCFDSDLIEPRSLNLTEEMH